LYIPLSNVSQYGLERKQQLLSSLAAQGASEEQVRAHVNVHSMRCGGILIFPIVLNIEKVAAALAAHARSEAECRRLRRQKTSVSQFETIKLIGKGAFGEVRLCRDLKNGDLVALKVNTDNSRLVE
jgi:hypothetical protein